MQLKSLHNKIDDKESNPIGDSFAFILHLYCTVAKYIFISLNHHCIVNLTWNMAMLNAFSLQSN